MESRFANSFFSGTNSSNNHHNNRRILENRNGDTHQHKRPKLNICLPKNTCSLRESSKAVEKSLLEDESIWEDFAVDVFEKAESIERASQAVPTEDSEKANCNIEKSGLLTKPIVKPVEKPASAVSKYPQVVASQRVNSPLPTTKQQVLKKTVIFKAASTGNLKAPHSPSSSSTSSSGISLFSHSSFSPHNKVTAKSLNGGSNINEKPPDTNKCKECETLSGQLTRLTDKLQTKDGEISLLRSNLEETRLKSFKGKDEMGSLVEKTQLLEKKISEQNTVINFMSGELQSKSQTCNQLKSSLKQRSSHTPNTASSKASANKSTITDGSSTLRSQLTEMTFTPSVLSQLAKHDGRLLFDICSAELNESHPSSFLKHLDGTCQDEQDDRWFVSILFEFQKHQSFATDLTAKCFDKLITTCRSSIEEIARNRETTVSQSQRIKELYNRHHEIAPLSKRYLYFSPKSWYSEELAIKERRLLHLISRIIDIEPKLAHVVVPNNLLFRESCDFKVPRRINGEKSLLHVLRDTLKLIKDECYSINLNGFLASSASLIISIVKSKIDLNEDGQKLINEIFRLILLCCPGPTALLCACEFLSAVDDKYSLINSDLCRNTPKEHFDSERSNTFDEGTCTITLICYLVQAMKNDTKIYRITDVLVRWLRILQTKWHKNDYPPWLNWGSLSQLPANHKLLCDCRFELNKLILKLLFEAAYIFSNESHRVNHEEKRCLEMLLDRGIALIFAAAIGEDRSLSIEPGEIEAHYELFVHTLSVGSDLNVSAIQRKNLKHLALQELKDPKSGDEDVECTEMFREMCAF